MTEHTKHIIDWGAAGAVAGTLMGWLPTVATILSIIWFALRIYEWFEKRWHKR